MRKGDEAKMRTHRAFSSLAALSAILSASDMRSGPCDARTYVPSHTQVLLRAFITAVAVDAPYVESRDAIGQQARPALHFVDFDDLRTPQPAVEHVYPLEHLRQRVDGQDGPCTRLTGMDGELAGQLVRSVPAKSASFKQKRN